jgi:hypothetical protein
VSSPLDILAIVVEALERAGGRYLVGGSLASSASGEPRQTNDIDLAVELSTADVPDFVAGLGSDFYADSGDIRDAFRRGLSANLVHLPSGLKIDMFPKGPGPFDDSEFQRRRLVNLEGVRSFYLESPEDTVIRKLIWYRKGDEVSERQWSDVLGILRVQGERLDTSYLRRWAAETGVSDLLERMFGESRNARG